MCFFISYLGALQELSLIFNLRTWQLVDIDETRHVLIMRSPAEENFIDSFDAIETVVSSMCSIRITMGICVMIISLYIRSYVVPMRTSLNLLI